MSTFRPDESNQTSAPVQGYRGQNKRKVNDQTIYDAIYNAVLTQRLPPGSRLPEVALGDLFGVSRSIVRKALTRLASSHVIEQRPNQMATVAKPTVEETHQIFDSRRLIESEVVRLCAGQLSKAVVKDLRKCIVAEKKAQDSGKHQDRVRHSMGIHLILAEHCPNQVLGRILRGLVMRTSIVIALYKASGVDACFLGDDHSHLAELITQGKGDDAARLVRQHLYALEDLLDLRDQPSPIDLACILEA